MKKLRKKLDKYIKRIIKVLKMQEMRVLPGNVAFFFVLALIPIITIILSMFSNYTTSLINLINEIFPEEASAVLISVISNKDFSGGSIIFNLVTFFVSSNGTYAIINAANTLYKVKESDPLKDRIRSIILLIILIGLIAFLILVPMLGGKILSLFNNYTIYNDILKIYSIIKWPLTLILIYVILKLFFTISPSKNIRSKDTTVGALFTTIIWSVATAIFGYYLQNFANYTIIYGNLSSIIILMMWIYIISYVLVLGMAINSVDNEENENK